MKLLLLQDEIYLPSYAGGIKANRFLLEALSLAGHPCLALTRALTRSPDGPQDRGQLCEQLGHREIAWFHRTSDVVSYRFRGVDVDAVDCPTDEERRAYCVQRIRDYQPDWVLVADDKRRSMLSAAEQAAAGRCIPILQTIVQLPFGPLSLQPHVQQTQLMQRAPACFVVSRFMQSYLQQHASIEARLLRWPVYGTGPFPIWGRFDRGYVTMINPCPLKGVSIFMALADAMPDVAFAVVPTWGAEHRTLRDLAQFTNVTILPPTDHIDSIFAQTRILLVPSLWPESFGYVVPEAMARGIPVLASDLGGLREAILGVDSLLPVIPASRQAGEYVCAPQEIDPWKKALRSLLTDAGVYQRQAEESRRAALDFISQTDPQSIVTVLQQLPVRSC